MKNLIAILALILATSCMPQENLEIKAPAQAPQEEVSCENDMHLPNFRDELLQRPGHQFVDEWGQEETREWLIYLIKSIIEGKIEVEPQLKPHLYGLANFASHINPKRSVVLFLTHEQKMVFIIEDMDPELCDFHTIKLPINFIPIIEKERRKGEI